MQASKEGSTTSLRVATYNMRAFFDRYHERLPLLKKTLADLKPDLLATQECMVSNSGMDKAIEAALSATLAPSSSSSFHTFSDPSIVKSLKLGVEDTDFPPVVAKIFAGIINVQLFLLSLPVIGWFTAAAPLFLETARERIGKLTGFDIWSLYYVTLAPFFGIATFVSPKFTPTAAESIVLMPPGHNMGVRKHLGTAYRVLVRDSLTQRPLLWFVNIHYTHFTTDEGVKIRTAETRRVLDWMSSVSRVTNDRVVITGDHNTLMPVEPLFGLMEEAGYTSGYRAVHKEEPKSTWPSGLKSVYMDVDGIHLHPNGVCLDYIWIKGGITIADAGLAGDVAAPGDDTLYPSDHIAVWADITVNDAN